MNRKFSLKRFLVFGLPALFTLVFFTVVYYVGVPKLEGWLEQRLTRYLNQQSDLNVTLSSVNIQVLPPSVTARNIHFEGRPQGTLQWLKPSRAQEISIALDFFSLLAGRIELSEAKVMGLDLWGDLNLLPKSQKSGIDLKPFFSFLKLVPLRKLILENFAIDLKHQNYRIKASHNAVLMEPGFESLAILTYSPMIKLSENEAEEPVAASASLVGEVRPDRIELSSFKLNWLNESQATLPSGEDAMKNLSGSGASQPPAKSSSAFKSQDSAIEIKLELSQLDRLFTEPRAHLEARVQLDLASVRPIFKFVTRLPPFLKKFESHVQFKTKMQINRGFQEFTHESELVLSGMQMSGKEFGKLSLKSGGNQKGFNNLIAKLEHSEVAGELKDGQYDFNQDNLSFRAEIKRYNLLPFLAWLNIYKTPVDLVAHGELICKGSIKSFNLQCEGVTRGDFLEVYPEMAKLKERQNPIVILPAFSINGRVNVNSQEVSWETALSLGDSKGQSKGRVHYENGFDIEYESPELFLKDIKNLANLKLEGRTAIKGRTLGNSSFGIFNMDLNTQDIWFEDFFLGQLNLDLKYKQGVLDFNILEGVIGESRLKGKFELFLKDLEIKFKLESLATRVEDLLLLVERKWRSPVVLSGEGPLTLTGEGPIKLSALSYHIKASFAKGWLSEESYENLRLNLNSNQGAVEVFGELQKKRGTVRAQGNVDNKGQLNILLMGQDLRLEESDFLLKWTQNLSGLVNFDMRLFGFILKPEFDLKTEIRETALGDQSLADSSLAFALDQRKFTTEFQLLGRELMGKIALPLVADEKTVLNLETRDWDFARFLSILSAHPLRDDFKSNLTLKVQLNSEQGGLFKSSGDLAIEKFWLIKQNEFLRNEKPLSVQFTNGEADIKNFELSSNKGFIRLVGENFTSSNLELRAFAKTDLTLFSLFLPFLEDLTGEANLDLQVGGSLFAPELYGRARVKNAFIKIKGLPHALEQLEAELDFSHQRVLISKITSFFAGGRLQGSGEVQVLGKGNVPVNLKVSSSSVQLNMPDKMRTNGALDLVFLGKWFPYTLSGTYRVQGGLITKSFLNTEEGDGAKGGVMASGPKQSIYLPQALALNRFSPLAFDIQIPIEKPVNIKNAELLGLSTGQIQLRGTPSAPLLFGQLKLEAGAQLYFRENTFNVNSATARFNSPLKIDPELFLSANSRIKDYDVSILLQGLSSNPQVSLTSEPPLAEQDLVSLLALGITSSKLENEVQSEAQAQQTGLQIGNAILSNNPINREIKETFGLDLKFSSSFDDSENVAIQKITASRNLGPKLNASVTTSLGQKEVYDLKLNYSINEKLSAVGTYEKSGAAENTSNISESEGGEKSIFGLDLEYRLEFK